MAVTPDKFRSPWPSSSPTAHCGDSTESHVKHGACVSALLYHELQTRKTAISPFLCGPVGIPAVIFEFLEEPGRLLLLVVGPGAPAREQAGIFQVRSFLCRIRCLLRLKLRHHIVPSEGLCNQHPLPLVTSPCRPRKPHTTRLCWPSLTRPHKPEGSRLWWSSASRKHQGSECTRTCKVKVERSQATWQAVVIARGVI